MQVCMILVGSRHEGTLTYSSLYSCAGKNSKLCDVAEAAGSTDYVHVPCRRLTLSWGRSVSSHFLAMHLVRQTHSLSEGHRSLKQGFISRAAFRPHKQVVEGTEDRHNSHFHSKLCMFMHLLQRPQSVTRGVYRGPSP
jgi:hypothetical protein